MSSGATALREAAPAKINLYLHIVGRRPDGLHLIDSLVVFAGLGDVVTVSPGDDISLTRSGPMAGDLPPAENDLVHRAARRLADTAGTDTPRDRSGDVSSHLFFWKQVANNGSS